MNTESYLGNTNIKRDGIVSNFTQDEVNEYVRCMKDPAYFARTYLKVIHLDKGLVPFNLYPYQEKMFDHFNSNRFSIVLACRQSGKSISSCAYLLWYALFHSEKVIAVLANKGATAREMLSRITLMLENIPFFLQPGCKALNKGSIEFSNNSKIIAAATSGSSIRGLSISLLFLDEFAFVENDVEFYTSTYPVISSGKTSRVIVTSTANGLGNTFHKIWEGAVQNTNSYKPFRVDWHDVPGRDEEWKRQTIENTSELQFMQEFGNCLEHNSVITIRLNSTIYDIRIGDLYEEMRLGERSGLPINEEILTPTGFQKFDGVKRYWHEQCLKFTFNDGKTLKTAFDHRFIIEGSEVFARNVKIGQMNIASIETINEPQYFYDPVNVRNGSIFNHDNGLISHNTFLGSGATLISGDKLLSLRAKVPTYTQGSIKVYDKPIDGHYYMLFADVAQGRGRDYSTFNIIDVSTKPFKQVCVYRDNMISPLLFPDIIYKYAKTYNDAYCIIESNDQGSVVCNGLYYELEYENVFVESAVKANSIGVRMDKKVKRIGCSNIKDLIESNHLEIVDDETIIELSTFQAKGTSYEASAGNHDDLVMNLVLLGWFSTNAFFKEMTDIDVRNMIHSENMQMIEDSLVPFGYIDSGIKEEVPGGPVEEIWDGTIQSSRDW